MAGDVADRFARLSAAFADEPGVTPPEPGNRTTFGASALKVNGAVFAMLTAGRLVVKLPAERVAEHVRSGTGMPFPAGGKSPMRQWLAVPSEDIDVWTEIAREALAFVRAGMER